MIGRLLICVALLICGAAQAQTDKRLLLLFDTSYGESGESGPQAGRLDAWGGATNGSISSYAVSGDEEDRLLVVGVMGEHSSEFVVDAVTFGDATMTSVASVVTGGNPLKIEIFILNDAGITGATGDSIAVTFTTAPTNFILGAGSYWGIDQTSPFASSDSDTGTNEASLTTTLDVDYGNAAVAACLTNPFGQTWTWTSPAVEQVDATGGSTSHTYADYIADATASVDFTCTNSQSPGNSRFASLSVELQVASE